jgi:hypothetical protein
VDVTGLADGFYDCNLTISDPNAENSPQIVEVTLSIECFPPDHWDYDEWVSVGMPDCWCYPRQCHGDVDDVNQGDDKVGYFYVWSNDLNCLVAGWKQPYGGNPAVDTWICCDFGHDEQGDEKAGYFRVWATDLGILVANWKSNPEPDCLDVP